MTRRLVVAIVGFVLACTCAFAPRASAQVGTDPPGIDPTHYWTYHMLQPFILPNQVFVQDQFNPTFVPIMIDSLTHMLNWVHKNNSPVPDTTLHYTRWAIENKAAIDPEANVVLTNQFGNAPATVHNVEFLLVPAWKNEPRANFPLANHYLCYKADSPQPPSTAFYDFMDEWRVDTQLPGPLQFLCVPCAKLHNGNLYPPVDTQLHLAVYSIQPQSEVFNPVLFDQFQNTVHPVAQIPPEWLFVPTLKQLIVTPTHKSSWGALKSHYR
jgi:hypothetical protein